MFVIEFHLDLIGKYIKSGSRYVSDETIQRNGRRQKLFSHFSFEYFIDRFYDCKTKNTSPEEAIMMMLWAAGKYFTEDAAPEHNKRHDWFVCTLARCKRTGRESICSVHYVGNNIPGLEKKLLIGSINAGCQQWLKNNFDKGCLVRNKFVIVKCTASVDSFEKLPVSVTSYAKDTNQTVCKETYIGVDVLEE